MPTSNGGGTRLASPPLASAVTDGLRCRSRPDRPRSRRLDLGDAPPVLVIKLNGRRRVGGAPAPAASLGFGRGGRSRDRRISDYDALTVTKRMRLYALLSPIGAAI